MSLTCPRGIREGEMMTFLKAFWQFCSYLFFPQWGRKRCKMSEVGGKTL